MKLEKIFLVCSLLLVLISTFHFGKKWFGNNQKVNQTQNFLQSWPQLITWQTQKNLVIQELLKPYPQELQTLQGYLKITSQWKSDQILNPQEVLELLSHYDTRLSQSILRLPDSPHKDTYLKQLRESEDQIRFILANK